MSTFFLPAFENDFKMLMKFKLYGSFKERFNLVQFKFFHPAKSFLGARVIFNTINLTADFE